MPRLPTTISMRQLTFPKMQSGWMPNTALFLPPARRTIQFVPPMRCVSISNKLSLMSPGCWNRKGKQQRRDEVPQIYSLMLFTSLKCKGVHPERGALDGNQDVYHAREWNGFLLRNDGSRPDHCACSRWHQRLWSV